VHLGDGGGGQRARVEFGEDAVGWGAELPAEQLLHLRPRGRGDLMVESAELVDELRGEQVAAGGQQLAELDEAAPPSSSASRTDRASPAGVSAWRRRRPRR
jgi:hypothetical protein